MKEKTRIGIIGLGQRGWALMYTILRCEEAQIVAVCDLYDDRIENASEVITRESNIIPHKYKDYAKLIKDEEVEVVIICSSWDEHVPMAIMAMEEGKVTGMEVGGAYDIEACWELVRVYERTKTPIMMLENCCWDKFELLSTSLARSGRLGKIVYGHGAYCHDLRKEILGGNVNRHYRLTNYIKRNCDNYPTHDLGPIAKIMDINRGNKMLTLTSVSTKPCSLEDFSKTDGNPDKKLTGQQFSQGDIVTTMISCANGETITLKLDTSLPRYYSREFFLSGTKGMCNQEANMVFFEDTHDSEEFFDTNLHIAKYLNNADNYEEYLPSIWRNITEEEKKLGHGGMDYLMMKAFLKAVRNKEEMPVDVYDAASWMSISAISEKSIKEGGAVQEIPDFTRGKWIMRKRLDVVEVPLVMSDK